MSLLTMSYRSVSVARRTPRLLDPVTVAAAMSLTRQPTRPAFLSVRISGGAANTGTVTATGIRNGVPGSEVLTFTGAAALATTGRYTSVNPLGLTTVGLADEVPAPTIELRAVGSDGSPVHQQVALVAGLRVAMDVGSATWPSPVPGSAEQERRRIYLDSPTALWTPREGDFVTDSDGTQWLVYGTPHHLGGLRPHHWEVVLVRAQGLPA